MIKNELDVHSIKIKDKNDTKYIEENRIASKNDEVDR